MVKTGNQMLILMADDDPEDFMIVRGILKENGFENDLHHCMDGRELMNYLMRCGKYKDPLQYPLPGVILLDLNMPGMNGREALPQIKGGGAFHHIPVVILSASIAPEDIEFCFQNGAEAYVEKSNSYDLLSYNLIDTLQAWIPKSTGRG